MFNWTTTTLVNEMPFVNADENKNTLRIGKHLFEKRWVESIRKALGHSVELCKATLDMKKVKTAIADAKVARLYIYVGLEGSEESIYANDWYRKGMPLSVSFVNATSTKENAEEAKTEAATVMAKAIEDTVKKFNVFTKVKKVLDVKADGANLVIEGTHEHQRLMKIAVLVGDGEIIGEEVPVLEWTLSEANYKASKSETAAYAAATGVTLDKAGVNGFGTYSQLLKDLRLPTPAHTGWNSVQKDEMPVVGAIYDQYIITYYAPSTANPSFTAVGNRSMSETTHVFWVKHEEGDNGLTKAWETALATIDPDAAGLNTIEVKADKRYNNKKADSVVG